MSREQVPPARFPAIVPSGGKVFLFGNDLGPTGFRPGTTDVLVAREIGAGSIGRVG